MTVRNAYFALGVASVVMGCLGGKDYDDDDDDDDAGSSGEATTGGTKSSGGDSGNGGSNGGSTSGGSNGGSTGGATTGGATSGSSGSNGGDVSAGGVSGSNGGSAAGGDAATGGSTGGTGGDTSTGGTGGDTSTGGTGGDTSTGGTGGDTSTGGTGGDTSTGGSAGGPTISCGSAFDTHDGGYVTSPGASGCWQGYPYTVTDALGTTITPSEFSACTEDSCSLCVSGTIVADEAYGSYAGLGFNANQINEVDAPQNTVIPTGTGLTISFTNSGGTTLRVQIQSGTTRWCYTLAGSSGTLTIPYSSFNTECWDTGSGVNYAGEAISGVQLTVPGSGVTAIPYGFCLVSAKDG